MTNLGPLTTTFIPSGADCTSTFIGFVNDNAWVQYGVGGGASSACLPTSFRPFASYFYSPGICPSGYTSACQAQISPSTGTLSDTEATCCPSSYSCHDDRGNDPFGCLSCFDGSKTFAVSTFFFSTNSAGSTTRIEAGTTTLVVSSNCVRVYAPIVHVAPGDILITASTSIPTLTQATSQTSHDDFSIIAPTVPPIATGNAQPGSSGLSSGAAAGIGIGCGLGAVLVIGAIVAILMRRRKLSTQFEPAAQNPSTYQDNKLQQQTQDQQHPYELATEGESGAVQWS
ncbi:hypothetical protein F4820DRAFT_411746 [Hypoxylon rubiginosum]|uniref:Uncharacterized protein n=1 Tax=Hypoxylon rubiginosum TaxID=110542 RepID=A0ACB9Z9A1_9PEZI|nr:hypothetical protein F4820DRAFT_411746 [Hypoxylon rubiginosum]